MSSKEIISNIDGNKFAEAKSILKDIVGKKIKEKVYDKQLSFGFMKEDEDLEEKKKCVKEEDNEEVENDDEDEDEDEDERG